MQSYVTQSLNVQISEYIRFMSLSDHYTCLYHSCTSEYVEGRGAVLVAGSVVDKEWERISGCITEVTLGADLGQSVVWIV